MTATGSKMPPRRRWPRKRIVWIGVLAAWAIVGGLWLALPHNPRTMDVSAMVTTHSAQLFSDPETPWTGKAAGTAALIEFFDYNCIHCRRMEPIVRDVLAADDQLRVIYKEFPILSRGSLFAARAALASRKQAKYAAFHTALLESEQDKTEATVLRLAAQVGLDVEKLKSDMEDPAIDAALDRNLRLAHDFQITGTPTFIIGHMMLEGETDLASLQALIREAREMPPPPAAAARLQPTTPPSRH